MNTLPVVIVTGLSGSGKSTALHVFEDMGFLTVDGLPASLVTQMVRIFREADLVQYTGIALGMDVRQGGFAAPLEDALSELKKNGVTPHILFLEASPAMLVRRYATTRRPHPLEREGLGLEQALEVERMRLDSLRQMADLVLDTSTYSIHTLRRSLQSKWEAVLHRKHALRLHIITFGFKYGTPAEADMMFDLRFLPNPYFMPELRELSGLDGAVAAYVLEADPGRTFVRKLTEFLCYVLEEYEKEGRYRLTLAIGCTGGRHRSVAVAEALAVAFRQDGYSLSLEHRHLDLG